MSFPLKLVCLVSALLLGGGWLTPNHYAPWASFYNEFPVALSLLMAAMAVYWTRQQITLPRPALLVGLLAMVPLAQYGAGLISFLGDAVMAATYLAALALSIVVGYALTRYRGTRFVDVFAWVSLLAAFVSLVLALHQWLGLQQLGVWLMDLPPGGRPYANLAQPNNLSTLFSLGLISAMYLRERGQFGTMVLALFALLLLAGLSMTRSRTAIFIVIVIAGWVFWGRKQFGLKCSPLEVLVASVMFAVLWAGWPTVSDWLYLSAESTFSRMQAMYTGEIRWVLWQQLLDALWRQPLFGYGWNQVSVAQMAVVADYPNVTATEYAHNIVLDVLIWNGVILGGVVLVATGWWLIARIRQVDSPVGWFSVLFVLIIGTHGLFEYPHAYLFFLLPTGGCVGMLCHESSTPMLQIPRGVYALTVALGIVLFGWLFVEYQTIETDYRLMRFEAIGIERRSPQSVAPKVVLLTQQQEFIKFVRAQAREGMTADELQWMRTVAHRYASPPALMRYALALGLNQRYEEAALELRRLKKIQHRDRFDEVRINWEGLVSQYPQLAKVALPAD